MPNTTQFNENLLDNGLVISYKGTPLALSSNFGVISFVSQDGNNTTAQVGQIDKPFKTVQAAIDATPAGGTIYIFAGTYVEALTVGKSITFYLYGATIRNTSTDATVSTLLIYNANTSLIYTVKILGFGTIERTGVTNADTATGRAVSIPFQYNIDLLVDGVDVVCSNAYGFWFGKGRNFTHKNAKITITGRGEGVLCNEAFNNNQYLFESLTIRTNLGLCMYLAGGGNRAILRDCDYSSAANNALGGVSMWYILEGCTIESKTQDAFKDVQYGMLKAINSKFIGNIYAFNGTQIIQKFLFQNCDFVSKTTFPVYLKPDGRAEYIQFQEFLNCRFIAHSSATQIFAYVDQYGSTYVKFINCTGNKDLPTNRYNSVIRNYIFEENLSDITI